MESRQYPMAFWTQVHSQIHDLSYDHQTAQNAMINAGLDQGYHTALETGYWPSEGVLPMDLRRFVDSG